MFEIQKPESEQCEHSSLEHDHNLEATDTKEKYRNLKREIRWKRYEMEREKLQFCFSGPWDQSTEALRDKAKRESVSETTSKLKEKEAELESIRADLQAGERQKRDQ